MVKKVSFDAIAFRIKDLVFIKVPADLANEIEGKRSNVIVAYEQDEKGEIRAEDIKKINILDDLKKWLLELSSKEPDTSITPRTVARNFKITENDAVKYLAILETDDIVKADESKGYLIYRVITK